VVRVRYEKSVLKALETLELEEGKEYKVIVEEDIDELVKKYRGVLGKSSVEEFPELEEEAQTQWYASTQTSSTTSSETGLTCTSENVIREAFAEGMAIPMIVYNELVYIVGAKIARIRHGVKGAHISVDNILEARSKHSKSP